MNVPHTLLADGTIVLSMPSGPVYLTIYSFNYHEIKALLPATSEQLAPLLVVPDCPDGIFYSCSSRSGIYLLNTNKHSITAITDFHGNKHYTTLDKSHHILKAYASLAAVQADYPEYLI